jgi:hypothetical protein
MHGAKERYLKFMGFWFSVPGVWVSTLGFEVEVKGLAFRVQKLGIWFRV